jgi:hypothetical protein
MSTISRSVNRTLGQVLGVQVVPAHTRRVVLSRDWFARLIHFNRLVEAIAEVEGDLVECGVASGTGLASLTSLLGVHGQNRAVWGFDSWAGLPAPTTADAGEESVAAGGMFSEASTAKVREELLAYGLPEQDIAKTVKLVPGFFSDTLPHYTGRIALLHIDVDLYQSYMDCLTCLWSHVAVGGIVAFDEYGDIDKWPGAQRAIDEFFSEHAVEATDLRHDEPSDKWWVTKRA